MTFVIGAVIVIACVFWWFARRSDNRVARTRVAPGEKISDNWPPTVDQMRAGLRQVDRERDDAATSTPSTTAADRSDDATTSDPPCERFFEHAYWLMCSSLDAPRGALENLLSPLTAGYCRGDHQAMYKAVFQHLPEGSWRWPAYEAHALLEQTTNYDDDLRAVKAYSLDDLLTCQKVAALRRVYKELFPTRRESPGRKKSEVIDTLLSQLDVEQKHELEERLREELLDSIEMPGGVHYRDMVVRLCSRLSALAYNEERKAQIAGYGEHCSEIEFLAGGELRHSRRMQTEDRKAIPR